MWPACWDEKTGKTGPEAIGGPLKGEAGSPSRKE